jgi:hypothetical protein
VKFVERKRLTRQESRLVGGAMLVDAAEEVILREGFEHTSVDGLRYEYGIFQAITSERLATGNAGQLASLSRPVGGRYTS